MISSINLRRYIFAAAEELNLPITTAQANRLADRVALRAARGLTPRVYLSSQSYSVLVGLASGEEVQVTAARMERSVDTVKAHRRRLYKALGAENGPHAVAIAMGLGLLRTAEQEAAAGWGGEAR